MKIDERKKLLIYKILILLFAFVIAFLPSTVSRNLEVNSRVIVEMLGLDEKDGEIEVTAQYVMPTATEGGTKDKVNVSGKTVTEAVENLSTALGRRAELGHCSMLIIGENLKPDVLASIMTGTDVTADVYVSGAETSAGELIGDLTEFMKKSGTTDADFIAYSAKRSHIATTTLLNFLSDLKSASQTAFVPIVELIEEESDGSSGGSGGSGESGSGSGGGEKKKQPIGMKTEKLALYGVDGRLGILEKEAARGIAWVSAPVEKSIVTADIEYDGKTYEGVSGRLIHKAVDIKLDKKSRSCKVKVKAKINPKCDKFNSLNASSDGAARDAIALGFENAIRSDLEKGYDAALELNSDPMYIVRKFYRFAPELSVTVDDLKDMRVEFDVRAEIK